MGERMKKMSFSYSSQPIMTINNSCKKKKIILNPKFQRGYIWKNEFKDELIVSILYNYPIGNIILSKNGEYLDVVDGQQRLKTIIYFIGDDDETYIIRTKNSVRKLKEILSSYYSEYNNILSESEVDDFEKVLGKGSISYSDLPSIVKDDFMSYNLNITTLSNTEKKTVVEYFKYVQNQETLKAGEIINSIYIYNNDLNDLISRVNNKDTLLQYLGFSVKRNEFDKHLINLIGTLNNKILMNAQSKYIVDFAEKFTHEMENREVHNLIANLNSLTKVLLENENTVKKKINTRSLKILLSYLSFYVLRENEVEAVLDALVYVENELKNKNEDIMNSIAFIQSRTRKIYELRSSAEKFRALVKIGNLYE